MNNKKALIIGAGPAGLTAAYELIHKTDIAPIVFEMTTEIGGLSRTVDYKGNKLDIGGHRFFSKSERVTAWWLNILPSETSQQVPAPTIEPHDRLSSVAYTSDSGIQDKRMLVRNRISHIYYLQKFFNYPISFSFKTFWQLGIIRTVKICVSYIKIRLEKPQEIKTLEDLFIHRFGKVLYSIFFKEYTEKVWGVPCNKIKPEWGIQRIKNLSIAKTVTHALKERIVSIFSTVQKNPETSLITQFLYPKYGPGQMWEEVTNIIRSKGGRVMLGHKVTGLHIEKNRIIAVEVEEMSTGRKMTVNGDYILSSMSVSELIASLDEEVPEEIRKIASGLMYRDMIVVGLLLKKLKKYFPDQWLYIQDKGVQLGRIQVMNNWSPYMVADPDTVWIGLEYFCSENDELWNMSDNAFIPFAINELVKINFIDREDVLDGTVIRQLKAYPAYFGFYDRFSEIRQYVDTYENLFLIGRNGMHKYNNQDHSMLTAMVAVQNIIDGIKTKDNIWNVNVEKELHEKR